MARMKKAGRSPSSENVKQQQVEDESFSFPTLLKGAEEEVKPKYIDLDIALPSAWESMKRQGSSKSSSADSLEFDFGRSLRSLDPGSDTPADELFYKGQLLPLLHKVKQDELDEDEEEDDGDEQVEVFKVDSFSFKSEQELGCLSPDRFPSGNSRSSSFRSCYWDTSSSSGVDNSGGDSSSSSCRDSNGSSQDSCFEAAPPSAAGVRAAAQVEGGKVVSLKDEGQKQGRTSLNWRKSPFKWKVLLGGSKRASLSASSSCSSTTSSASSGSRNGPGFRSLANDRRRNHSFTYGSSASTSTSTSGPLLSSFFSAGDKSRHSISSSSAGKRSECLTYHSFRDSATPSSVPSSSSNKVLHKYLKLLKPFVASGANNLSSYTSSSSAAATRKNETNQYHGPGPSSTRQAARSMDDWRAAMAYYDQQHDKELITCPSFLPGSLRVSSFSSRRSSTHASCVTSSRSSPNHSGVLRQCLDPGGGGGGGGSSSSMADLQSAIQGAIAHCKKSHTNVRLSNTSVVSVPAVVGVSSIDLGSTTAAHAAARPEI